MTTQKTGIQLDAESQQRRRDAQYWLLVAAVLGAILHAINQIAA